MDGKSNKTMSMASKAQFQPPEIDPEAIFCMF